MSEGCLGIKWSVLDKKDIKMCFEKYKTCKVKNEIVNTFQTFEFHTDLPTQPDQSRGNSGKMSVLLINWQTYRDIVWVKVSNNVNTDLINQQGYENEYSAYNR